MAARGLSQIAMSRGFSLVAVLGFLIAMASHGSRVHGLSCPAAHGIFPNQEWNLCQCGRKNLFRQARGFPKEFVG